MMSAKRLKNGLQQSESMRQQQAELEKVNLYIHTFLKQSGLAKQIVEEVGIDFIDFDLPDTEGNETTRINLERRETTRET